MEPVQERERTVLQATKQKEDGDFKCSLISDTEMQFESCPVSFHSYFGPVFPHRLPFPPFWKSNVHTMPLYVGRL